MQDDVDTVATAVPIRISGINLAGEESDNALMCQGRVLPWLQDTPGANVWAAWQANWRDVVVLDDENKIVAIYNLTSNNLAVPEKYAELRAILLNTAQ